MVRAAAIWHERYRRATSLTDEAGNRVPALGCFDPEVVSLWHEFIAVQANAQHLRRPGTPNPWHRQPPDMDVIREGSHELLDRIGAHVGIGPFPRGAMGSSPPA